MSKKDDSVFQVSLTELAFTLVLILLLLLGWRVGNLSKQLEVAKEITNMGICKLDPNENFVDTLMPCAKCVAKVEDLDVKDARMSIDLGKELVEQFKSHNTSKKSLEDFKKEMAEAAKKLAVGHSLVTDEEQQKKLDEAVKAIAKNQELEEENSLLRKEYGKLTADNKELHAQKSNLQNRVGWPSCWITAETYKPQFLFNVVINEDSSYTVTPGWPEDKEAAALSVPGVKEMIEKEHLTKRQFNHYGAKILAYSKAYKKGECRFFVRMKSNIPDRPTADRARLNLENYFYKHEILN